MTAQEDETGEEEEETYHGTEPAPVPAPVLDIRYVRRVNAVDEGLLPWLQEA